MHHQMGADSLRLRLLLMRMMTIFLHDDEECCRSTNGLSMTCIGKQVRYVSREIRDAATCGDDKDSASTISVKSGAAQRKVSKVVLVAEYKYSGAR